MSTQTHHKSQSPRTNGRTSDRQLPADELLVGSDSQQPPVLSVVMPTLNEEAGITECIDRIKTAIEELQLPTEIIVSDSSTDRTPEIAREMGAKVVHPDKKGYGYAYRFAFEQTRGEYMVMGDADTTYDFEQIPRLLEALRDQDGDSGQWAVDWTAKSSPVRCQHSISTSAIRALTAFLNAFYDAGVSDSHSGFRIFTREAYERMDLQTDGMEFASEMIMDAGARDLEIVEVPIVYHEREGEANLESFRDGWRHVRFMLLNAPGYLFSAPGIGLGIFGFVVMGIAYTGVSLGGITLGTHSMIAGSLLTIVGYQIFTLGLFSTVGSDPIRRVDDPVTNVLEGRLTLERGALLGTGLLVGGGLYAASLVATWVGTGFSALPFTLASLVAFTAIVLGLQTVFSAFFLSEIADARPS
jgi:Glycosyltransferases involved in cell wall biogenesis